MKSLKKSKQILLFTNVIFQHYLLTKFSWRNRKFSFWYRFRYSRDLLPIIRKIMKVRCLTTISQLCVYCQMRIDSNTGTHRHINSISALAYNSDIVTQAETLCEDKLTKLKPNRKLFSITIQKKFLFFN